MKTKAELEEMHESLTTAAIKTDSTVRAIEAYAAIKTMEWVLGLEKAGNNLPELVKAIESSR